MFLKNKNIIFKIRTSKVTDYAALTDLIVILKDIFEEENFEKSVRSQQFLKKKYPAACKEFMVIIVNFVEKVFYHWNFFKSQFYQEPPEILRS